MTGYPKAYIDACRSRVASELAAFRRVAQAQGDDADFAAFEHAFFQKLLASLGSYFPADAAAAPLDHARLGRLTEQEFARVAERFFDEIERGPDGEPRA